MLRVYLTPHPRITSENGDISSPPSDGDTPGAPPPRAAAPPGQFFQELLDRRLFGQFAPPSSAPPGKFFEWLTDPRRFGQAVPQPAPPGQFLPSIGVHLPPVVPPAPAPPPAAPAAPAPGEGEGDGLARNAAAGLSEGVYGTLGLPVDAATWLVNRGIDGVNAVAGSEISNLGDLPLGSHSIATNLEHYAGIPDPAKVRAATLAEKAARAAGEGASYAIAPQAQSRSLGRNVISGLVQQTALGNADPLRALGGVPVAGSIGMSAAKAMLGPGGVAGERFHPERELLAPNVRYIDPAIGRSALPHALDLNRGGVGATRYAHADNAAITRSVPNEHTYEGRSDVRNAKGVRLAGATGALDGAIQGAIFGGRLTKKPARSCNWRADRRDTRMGTEPRIQREIRRARQATAGPNGAAGGNTEEDDR